jgi:putative membrane protein
MILELILPILFGIFFGIICGLIPGLHTNLISALTITALPFLLSHFSPFSLAIFVVALSVTNMFLEFIPSTYLGAPDEDTALSILPGHELLLKGKAHFAIFLSSLGSLIGLFLTLFLSPILFISLSTIYPFFELMMPWLLVWVCIMILLDNEQMTLSIIIFILSGFLGIGALNLNINQPLLPLLTGLFGTSGIIASISEKTNIPLQNTDLENFDKRILIKPAIISSIISLPCSFLPGLGSSQATAIGSKLTKEISREQFLILNSTINPILMSLSFVTVFLINKSRTGSASAISEIIQLASKDVWTILAITILVGVMAFFITLKISKTLANKIQNINYAKLSWTILIFLIIMTGIISGFMGLLVLTVSTCLGLTCQYYGIKKGLLMSCLLIPTIIIYLPF